MDYLTKMNYKKFFNVHTIIALTILIGSLFWLYAALSRGPNETRQSLYTQQIFSARVTRITAEEKRDIALSHSNDIVQTLLVEVQLSDDTDTQVTILNDLIPVDVGDTIYVKASSLGTPSESFDIVDVKRQSGMLWLAILFAGFAVIVGGFKGLRALIGLVASIAVVFGFVIPQILAGHNAIWVSLIAALGIVAVNIYLIDGLSKKSLIAITGIFVTVVFTAWLTQFTISHLHFTGYTGEEAVFLNEETSYGVSLIGILVAGIIISALGVLDDVAVTQVSVVAHLAHANPKLHRWQLFKKAMSIGRDHIAAVINTLALAYVGASLPLLLLLSVQRFAISYTINSEVIATEIVTILISTTSLILSVPITTLLASAVGVSLQDQDTHSS